MNGKVTCLDPRKERTNHKKTLCAHRASRTMHTAYIMYYADFIKERKGEEHNKYAYLKLTQCVLVNSKVANLICIIHPRVVATRSQLIVLKLFNLPLMTDLTNGITKFNLFRKICLHVTWR